MCTSVVGILLQETISDNFEHSFRFGFLLLKMIHADSSGTLRSYGRPCQRQLVMKKKRLESLEYEVEVERIKMMVKQDS